MDSSTLQGMNVAFLVANEGIEQVELTKPWEALSNAGATCQLVAAGQTGDQVQAYRHLTPAERFPIDVPLSQADASDFGALVLPGGVANGDQLRTRQQAVDFVAKLAADDKPIAAICHGAWVLIEAGVTEGKTMTSWPSLATDLRNAGARWVDQELVIDQGLISSRKPDDLPAFCDAITKEFGAANRRR